jgi:hypothetical protein
MYERFYFTKDWVSRKNIQNIMSYSRFSASIRNVPPKRSFW